MVIEDSILNEDFEYIAECGIDFSALAGKTVLVTGATGLIGSYFIRAMAFCNELKKLNINILALVRNIEKAKTIYGAFYNDPAIRFIESDINDDHHNYISDEHIDIIIHAASVTTSKIMVEKPVETIRTALIGTENMLKLAEEKKVSLFVYVSSMEAYGTFKDSVYVSEDDMGYIDPVKIRSNYSLCKRMCENMCIAYYSEYGVPVRIARLSQTFGAGILPWENRVFAQFARSAIENKDIVLRTKGLSEGNYCYTRDTITALLYLIVKGKDGEAYNIANEANHTNIADMAELVAQKIADGRIKVVFDIDEDNRSGYAPDTKMKLNTSKIRSLGWTPSVDMEESYRRMIKSMVDNK